MNDSILISDEDTIYKRIIIKNRLFLTKERYVSMGDKVIINKLLEKGIIKSEKDIDEDLKNFISLRSYYDIDEILQSGLLEKYPVKILNECIGLKPNAKLMYTRFNEGMSIQEIELYCKIKLANPELDIPKNDKFLHSINKEYIDKYGAGDLGFIIEKLDILSHFSRRDEKGEKNSLRRNYVFF